jgi:capsular exopolysaccharide synthesis family protein
MSEFYTILQRAECERALREEARRGQDVTGIGRPAPPATPMESGAPTGVPPAPPVCSVPPPTVESAESLDHVEGHLVSLLSPVSVPVESYRMVRHRLEQLHRTTQLAIVAVSSAMVAEGKTTTAINLAGALAQASDTRVLLVDADLRNPSIARYLALGDSGRRGLVDAILDPDLDLDDVVSPRPPFNLDVLPAGILRPAPYEVLKSPRLGDLLDQARRRYDYVVLDTAPLLAVPDSRLIGNWVDGFLLVVAAHKTPRRLVAETLDLMEPTKLVALLFNGDDEHLSAYTYPTSLNGSSRYDARSARAGSLWRRSTSAVATRLRRRTSAIAGPTP